VRGVRENVTSENDNELSAITHGVFVNKLTASYNDVIAHHHNLSQSSAQNEL
jgi:hypothetical protein